MGSFVRRIRRRKKHKVHSAPGPGPSKTFVNLKFSCNSWVAQFIAKMCDNGRAMVHMGELHSYYFALDHDFDLFFAPDHDFHFFCTQPRLWIIVLNLTIFDSIATVCNLSRKFWTCLGRFISVWIGWQLSVQFESFPDICPDSLKCVRTIWKVESIRQPTGGSSLVICDMNSLHKQSLGWRLADAVILNWH